MKAIILDQQERILAWMQKQVDSPRFLPDAKGVALEEDGELIAGVAFENWTGSNIFMHVAVNAGVVLTRARIKVAFAYPFLQLKCRRITGLVRADNMKSQQFAEHLGFKQEGRLRHAANDGTDMLVFGLLREECKWLGVTP